jgi:2-polyprenyl-6-methoxyphenol hydroxylase-like FAD-dependent oxidoreductase
MPLSLTKFHLHCSVGHGEYIISRPELYDLLYNSIPRERFLLGKRILSSIQNEDSVLVRCSDNSSYHGDILVGADGAYSAVRQNLYKSLKEDKKLPASDDVSLPFSCVCLVGQTIPLDPEEFPLLKEELGQFHSVLGVSSMCTVRLPQLCQLHSTLTNSVTDIVLENLVAYVDHSPKHGVLDGDSFLGQALRQKKRLVPQL